jgi:hypothetical protein
MRGRTLLAALAVGLCGTPALAQDLGSTLQTARQTVQDTEKSQGRIDQLDGQTQSLLSDYRANLKQLEQLNRYNASQQRQIAAQQRELESLRKDIDNISGLQRSVQPLMEDMLAALERFVEADMPFLADERRDRIARLRGIMEDPERSAAQRYRLIVEAYQIENEYGRTIESYRGSVELDGNRYENAEFLRLGRMALIVRTDDDSVLKRFDLASRAWVDLDRSFLPHVKTGLRIAREQIPPDLMIVPVTAPQAATGG